MKIVIAILVFCLLVCGCKNGSEELTRPNTLGSTFEFDGLEISIGSELKWSIIDNQASDKNGAEVFGVLITIKNLTDKTHGLKAPYITRFGSRGSKLGSGVDVYFEDSMFTMGDLRSGAEGTAYLYFLYDGDGTYYIELSNRKINAEVELVIEK